MVLAVDIGTSSMKGGLISREGKLLSYHRVRFSEESLKGDYSFDPGLWSQGLVEIIDTIAHEEVEALAISGNCPTMVPCDDQGLPLGAALMWHKDYRDPSFSSSSYYLPALNWLRNNHSDVYNKASLFLSCPEMLYMQLTGRAVMVSPNADYIPYIWTDSELELLDFPKNKFPEILEMGSIVGTLSDSAVLESSLSPSTPVIACGMDFIASLIGSGALKPGRICDRAGTSEGINYCSAVMVKDSRVRGLPHPVSGLSHISAILSSTGSLFEWYRHLTGQESDPYKDTMAGVDAIDAEQDHPLFFPSMKGENLWEFSNGMFTGLDPAQGKYELGRAVMEAIGFAVRRSLEIFEESDLPVKELRVSGGQAKSAVWNQMKADITGKIMLIPEIEDAELLGCACLAYAALGDYPTFVDASEALVKIKSRFYPRTDYYDIYNRKYQRYRSSCESVVSFYKGYPGS